MEKEIKGKNSLIDVQIDFNKKIDEWIEYFRGNDVPVSVGMYYSLGYTAFFYDPNRNFDEDEEKRANYLYTLFVKEIIKYVKENTDAKVFEVHDNLTEIEIRFFGKGCYIDDVITEI